MDLNNKFRSWSEIDLNALEHNANELVAMLEGKHQFMAIVKADAYGHGAIRVSRKLNQIGVTAFGVASLEEAVELRQAGIEGDILILGYTDPQQCQLIHDYDLIQTLISYEHAEALQQQRIPIRAHLKVNTGMNRLGVAYEHLETIVDIYGLDYIKVEGIFSHLSVVDSQTDEDIAYTHQQITHFEAITEALKRGGIDIGKRHLQSSYGLLNYPELAYDFVRIGISMYGVYSSAQDKPKVSPDLKPVLSIKSRIVLLRSVEDNADISYGRTHTAEKGQILAVVPIGYADGLPRSGSNRGHVVVKGIKAPIIGRICMDQLMIDVTHVTGIQLGDVVTVLGTDHGETHSAEMVAADAKTITNEILSRIGHRLPKIYI